LASVLAGAAGFGLPVAALAASALFEALALAGGAAGPALAPGADQAKPEKLPEIADKTATFRSARKGLPLRAIVLFPKLNITALLQ
jgi:hypothetical protein